MKNLLKTLSKSALLLIFSGLISPVAVGQTTAQKSVDHTQRIEALDNMGMTEMINSVPTGRYSELIQKFQNKEGKTRLLNGKFGPKSGCSVEALRNKEVLLVTIPASKLFAPNSVELLPGAGDILAPFRRYLKDPDMYRVLLVMHTDNTGDDLYRTNITSYRADAVFDWFVNSGADTRYLFPYAVGDDMPLHSNTSFTDRAANRRLEIYLVPGQKMIEQAKKGRIAF